MEDKYLFIIYDVEILLFPDAKGKRRHEVNLVCASHRCAQCKDTETCASCMFCGDLKNAGYRDFSFRTMNEFIEHVLEEQD